MGPIFLLIMIPLWQQIIRPFLKKYGYQISPLCSVGLGGICASLSFVCAGILQIFIENEQAINENPLTNSSIKPTITILWQIPQFVLIMLGEIFLSIPGLEFSFIEAPATMKSVLTASWFINNAVGNLIVIIITETRPFTIQSNEFFFYAGLMFVCVLIFGILASKYKYTRRPSNDSSVQNTYTNNTAERNTTFTKSIGSNQLSSNSSR